MAGRKDSCYAPMPGWEHFSHEADVGIRGYGPTLEVAFEQAVAAMPAVAILRGIRPTEAVEVATALKPNVFSVNWRAVSSSVVLVIEHRS